MRRLTFVLLPCLAIAVAACGGSKSSTSAAVTTTPTHTVTVTTSATTASTPTTTTAPSGPPPCRAAMLALSYIGSQGAAGHGLIGFQMHNTTSTTCSTIGYPGVLFLDKAGKPLPTIPARVTQDYFGRAPKIALTVPPAETVSFRIGVTHVPIGNATCTTAYGLQVIPPNDTSTLHVAVPGGFYECSTATVTPLQAGSSAYPGA